MNYFEVGSQENIFVHSSSFKNINPEEGGSPRKFISGFSSDEVEKEKKKLSDGIVTGKLIHSYIEDKERFILADFNLPTEMMTGLIDAMQVCASEIKNNLFNDNIDITFESNAVKEKKLAEEQLFKDHISKLATFLKLDNDNTIRAFRKARVQTKAYKAQLDLSVLNNIMTSASELAYLDFYNKKENKIVLTKEAKEKVSNAIQSLELNTPVAKLLGLYKDDLEEETNIQVYRELPIFWTETVIDLDGVSTKINCKALLDNLQVDHDKKIITYTDLKSTSFSIYTFSNVFEQFRYYRQMAFYTRAITHWFKSTFPDKQLVEYAPRVNIVAVETNGYFNCAPFVVNPGWLFKGSNEYKDLLKRIAWHQNNGFEKSYEEIKNNGFLTLKKPE